MRARTALCLQEELILRALVRAIPRVLDLTGFPPGEWKMSGIDAKTETETEGIFVTPAKTGATDAGVTGTIAEAEMTAEDISATPGEMGKAAVETQARIRVSETTAPASEPARAREECTGMNTRVRIMAAALGAAAEDKNLVVFKMRRPVFWVAA